VKRRTQGQYHEDKEKCQSVEAQMQGSTHKTCIQWLICEAHMKPASKFYTWRLRKFSKTWDQTRIS